MKSKSWFFAIAVLIGMIIPLFAAEQELPALAIFPFTSGNNVSETDRDALTQFFVSGESFKILAESFEVLPRTNTAMSAVLGELNDQQKRDLLDIDAIVKQGMQEKAKYVFAGHVTKFQDYNMALISIVEVGKEVSTSRMLAGYYAVYRNLTELLPILKDVAAVFREAIKEKQAPQKILSIRPFYVADTVTGTDSMDAETLAQILAIEIANSKQYDVRPRVNTVRQALQGVRDTEKDLTTEEYEKIAKATGAQYVLSAQITSLEDMKTFMVAILNLERGSQIAAGVEKYTQIREGVLAMPKLSKQLTGKKATGKHLARVQKAIKKQSAPGGTDPLLPDKRAERKQKWEAWKWTQKQKREEWREENLTDTRKFWSIGASAGIKPMKTPSFLADVHGTIPVTPYTFLEIGTDISTHASDIKDVTYFSLFPYGHFNVAYIGRDDDVLDWVAYIGIGAGYMMSTYIYTDSDNETVRVHFPVLDIPMGFKIGKNKHLFDMSYTVQIRIDGTPIVNHKIMLGYTYRFFEE